MSTNPASSLELSNQDNEQTQEETEGMTEELPSTNPTLSSDHQKEDKNEQPVAGNESIPWVTLTEQGEGSDRERAESIGSIESLGNISNVSDDPGGLGTQVSIELQDIFEPSLASKPPDVASIPEQVPSQEPPSGIVEQMPAGGTRSLPTLPSEQEEQEESLNDMQAVSLQEPSAQQLANTDGQRNQQIVAPVEISGGHYKQMQLGGQRTFNIQKEVHVAGEVQTGTTNITVNNTFGSLGEETPTALKSLQDEAQAKGMYRLSDTIHMDKKRALNPKQTIFYGEQISTVTPAQPLAIKLIPYDGNLMIGEGNKKEASLLLSMKRHRNVISFIHSGLCEQGPLSFIYIAMDLCHEKNLNEFVHGNIAKKVPFDAARSILQAKQITEGLKHIHEFDIVHRDLKPQNILLTENTNNLVIADFGISKPMTSGRSVTDVTNSRAGTDGYRAPETYNSNQLSRKADVFSLGLVLYFLWSNGHHAFGDDPDDWNSNIKKNRDRDLSKLLVPDKELALDLLQWILKFKPEDRPTAAQILNHKIFGGSELAPTQETKPKDRPSAGRQSSFGGGDGNFQMMFSLQEKAEQLMNDGDYRSARESLQNLRAIQEHPTEKLETLKQITECLLMSYQPHIDEINEIILMCRSMNRSPDNVRATADGHLKDSLSARAYIMYVCANKMYKADSQPEDAVIGIQQCVSSISDCVAQMVQQGLQGLISGRVIPSMREMLTGLSSKDVPSDSKVKNEAECLKSIGNCYRLVGDYDRAQNSCNEGIKLFKEHYTTRSQTYKVFGRLLNELGLLLHSKGKYAEATSHYEQAIEAIQNAADFSTEKDKQSEIDGMKKDLEKSRSQKPPEQQTPPAGKIFSRSRDASGSQASSNVPQKVFPKPSKPPPAYFPPRTTAAGTAPQGGGRKTERNINDMISLKENSRRYLEAGEYSLACASLKDLVDLQEDSWSQIETLQQIVECQVMCNQPCDDELNRITDIYRSINMSSRDIRSTAEKHLLDSQTFPAYILLICSSKMFKYDTVPSEAVRHIRESVQLLKHILEQMMKKPRLRRTASSQVIPTMYQLLEELRQFDDVSGEIKVTNEALTLNAIASCHDEVDEYDKSLDVYNEAVELMKREYGSNVEKCHVFGALLHNIGTTKSYQKKYDEALVYYEQALEVGERAEDWSSDDQREKSLEGTRTSLQNARSRSKKTDHLTTLQSKELFRQDDSYSSSRPTTSGISFMKPSNSKPRNIKDYSSSPSTPFSSTTTPSKTFSTSRSRAPATTPPRSGNFAPGKEINMEKMIELKTQSELYMTHNEYSLAYDNLQQLVTYQRDAWSQMETFQQIAECQVMRDQSQIEEINKIISICKSLHLSPGEIYATADKYLDEGQLVRSYVMCICSSKMHKVQSDPTDAVEGIAKCISKMDDVAKKMTKKPRLRRIGSNHVIPFMFEMLAEFRSIEGVPSQFKAEKEASCLNNIGSSYYDLEIFEKALNIYNEGAVLMEREFGDVAMKYRMFGSLLHNIGTALDNLDKHSEAVPYYVRAIEAQERAEDFQSEEAKQHNIRSTRKFLKPGDRIRTNDQPTWTAPASKPFKPRETEEYKFQSLNTMDENEILVQMVSLRDKSELYFKHGEYSLACESLQQLIQLQVNPDEKLELLQQIAECQVMCGQSCDKEINTIISLCRTQHISANDLKPTAQEHFTESRLVRAYVMFVCISQMFKHNKEPSDDLQGMRESVQVLRHIVEKMVKQARLRKIVSSHVIPSMHEMLADIRQIDNVSTDERVENEALTLNAIASSVDDIEEHEEAVKLYLEGMSLMEKEFGSNVTACHVYGALLHNIGTSKCHQRKFVDAEEFYIRAIEAKQSALDFKSEEKKQSDVSDAQDSLERCRTLMKKFHQVPGPKQQSSFQSNDFGSSHQSTSRTTFKSTDFPKPASKEFPSTSFERTTPASSTKYEPRDKPDFSTSFERTTPASSTKYEPRDKPKFSDDRPSSPWKSNANIGGNVELDLAKSISLQEKSELYMKHFEYQSAYNVLKELQELQGDAWKQFETLQQIVECLIMTDQSCDEEMNEIISTCKYLRLSPRDIHSTAEKCFDEEKFVRSYIMFHCAGKLHKTGGEVDVITGITKCASRMDDILKKLIKKPRYRRVATSNIIPAMKELLQDFREMEYDRTEENIVHEAECLHFVGSGYHEINDYETALQYFGEGIQLLRELGEGAYKYRLFSALLNNTGSSYFYLGHASQALPYHEEARSVVEYAEDFPNEEQKEKGTKGIEHNLQTCLKHGKRSDWPATTPGRSSPFYDPGRSSNYGGDRMYREPKLGAPGKTAPGKTPTSFSSYKKPQSTSNTETNSLKEKSQRYMEQGEHLSACDTLQKLIEKQEDPREKLETLQKIAECHVMCDQPCGDDVNEIVTTCQSLRLSPKDMETTAGRHEKESQFVRAYVMYVAACKAYKSSSSPHEAVRGIKQCFLRMRQIVIKLAKQPRLRRIASGYITSSMHDIMQELHSINVTSQDKATTEAGCLSDIGVGHNSLGEYKKALEAYDKGVEIMKKEFGAGATKYKVYGGLLNNIAVSRQMLHDNVNAVTYFKQAIEAKEKAEDYPDHKTKQEGIASSKKKLKNCHV